MARAPFAPRVLADYALARPVQPESAVAARALLDLPPVTEIVTKTYYYAGAQLMAMRVLMGTTGNMLYYLHTDHLGSTSLTTNIIGTVVARQYYYPYGGVRSGGGLPTDIGFTGQRAESGLGSLMYFRARFYTLVGRFLNADTIVPGAENPQALNRYSYVINNPLKHVDPSGHTYLCDEECEANGGRGTPPKPPIPPKPPSPTEHIAWEWDSQDLADSLPGTSQQYADAATALDGAALVSDIAAEAFVLTLAGIGAAGTSVEGTPVAGVAGAYAGYWMGQIVVRPSLAVGNALATLATFATAISEAKTGANRLQLEVSIGPSSVTAEANLSIGSGTQVGATTTGLGWIAPLTEPSLILQSIALASDLGWVSTPWRSINFHFP